MYIYIYNDNIYILYIINKHLQAISLFCCQPPSHQPASRGALSHRCLGSSLHGQRLDDGSSGEEVRNPEKSRRRGGNGKAQTLRFRENSWIILGYLRETYMIYIYIYGKFRCDRFSGKLY